MVNLLELAASPNRSLGSALVPHVSMALHHLHLLLPFCLPSHMLLWKFLCVLTFQSSFFHLRSLLVLDLLSSVSFQHHNFSGMPSYMSMKLLLLSFRKALTASSFLFSSARCLMGSLRPSYCCLMDTDGDSWPPRFFICLDS